MTLVTGTGAWGLDFASTFYTKDNALLGPLTTTSFGLLTDQDPTEMHLSTSSDTIIALRYVGMEGALRRGLTVLQMRGSDHAKELREHLITDTGMYVGEPFGTRLWGNTPQLL